MVKAFAKRVDENRNFSIDAYKQNQSAKRYERYDFVYEKMKHCFERKPDFKFLDIGCGDGGFLAYLKQRHPAIQCFGLELSQELIRQAKRNRLLKDAVVIRGDLRRFISKETFDVVLMSGVLSIFDDLDVPLRCLLKHLEPGGYGYVFGGFCSEDIDVLVRYRNNYLKNTTWESGLNMFSLNTVKKKLQPDVSKIHLFEFKLGRDLRPQKNPIRTYTLRTREKGRIVINGANIVREFYLIEFQKRRRGNFV